MPLDRCEDSDAWVVGLGNPDVYTNMKHSQDMQLLVFFCGADKVEALQDSIIAALDATSRITGSTESNKPMTRKSESAFELLA